MHRTDAEDSTVDGKFTDGDPGTGAQATVLGSKWLNNTQEELCTVVETAGLTLNAAANDQLLIAIRRLIRQEMQPIGSFWVTALTTPAATYWGFGTWVKRPGALYGQADGDPQFSTPGPVGSTNHKHSTGDHTLTAAQMAAHVHAYRDRYHAENATTLSSGGATNWEFMVPGNYNNNIGTNGSDNDNSAFAYIDSTTNVNAGAGNPHNHGDTGDAAALPRGRVVYIWERTA